MRNAIEERINNLEFILTVAFTRKFNCEKKKLLVSGWGTTCEVHGTVPAGVSVTNVIDYFGVLAEQRNFKEIEYGVIKGAGVVHGDESQFEITYELNNQLEDVKMILEQERKNGIALEFSIASNIFNEACAEFTDTTVPEGQTNMKEYNELVTAIANWEETWVN